jgi:hypothetical protein
MWLGGGIHRQREGKENIAARGIALAREGILSVQQQKAGPRMEGAISG